MFWHLRKHSSLIWNHLLHLPWALARCSRSSVPEMRQPFHHKIFVYPGTPPHHHTLCLFNSYFSFSSPYNRLLLHKIFPDLPHFHQVRSVSFVISCHGSVFFSFGVLSIAHKYTFLQSTIWSMTISCTAQILSSLKTKTMFAFAHHWPTII